MKKFHVKSKKLYTNIRKEDIRDIDHALELSINKWNFLFWWRLFFGRVACGMDNTCGLCIYTDQLCDRCPIGTKTGRHYCGGTPYTLPSITRKQYLAQAWKEIRFLKSLRKDY